MRSPALILLVLAWAADDHLRAQGAAGEAADRGRSRGITVLVDEGSPTDRALAGAVQELLAPERVRAVRRDRERWTPGALRDLDGPAASILLAVGADPAAAALAGTRRAPLLLCGRLDERVLPLRADAVGERQVVVMALPGMQMALPAALERFLPEVRRVGLITRREHWPLRESGGRGVSIVGIHAAERSVSELIAELAPRADALLILDEPGILASGEALVSAAQRAGMPVVTDAPWLARSGAALGVLPRLDLWAVLIAARLREIGGPPAPGTAAAPPPRIEIDVGALDRLGMLPEPARLAAAQVLRGAVRERGR